MKNALPELFIDRLRRIIPAAAWERAFARFAQRPPPAFRVNTLKASAGEVKGRFRELGVDFAEVPWCEWALTAGTGFKENWQVAAWLAQGVLYQQNLSSMFTALALNPAPGEAVLDMCAAPGSKTSLMAALMKNEGRITAVEAVKTRLYKLRAVLELLGVTNTEIKLMDARRFKAGELYDKALIDAPCSSEGRFDAHVPKTLGYWSLRKIREMVRKQRGLALSAYRALKPGGELIYSTCTFAPEENEGVITWLLRKAPGAALIDIAVPGVKTYPCLSEWQEAAFDPRAAKAVRILPDGAMDGFFLARIRKGEAG